MDGTYSFSDFPGFSMMHEGQLYDPDEASTMVSCQEPVMKDDYISPFVAWSYPYFKPSSPLDDSLRSDSPSIESQSSHYISPSPANYEDAIMPSTSHVVSSPSPSYPEPPVVAHLEPEACVVFSEPAHSIFPISLQTVAESDASTPLFHTIYPRDETLDLARPATPEQPSSSSTKKENPSRSTSRNKPPIRPKSHPPSRTSRKSKPREQRSRVFDCCFARYGCPSTFPSKNEWKRHVSSQHIQPGFFRCDRGRCSRLNNVKKCSRNPHPRETLLVNDFNRKDLFIQHQRRMHAPWAASKHRKTQVTEEQRKQFESGLDAVWKRCWHPQRVPPERSQCGFCLREFTGQNSWKERMEHVAKHFEEADPGPEVEDVHLREWAVAQGIVGFADGQWTLTSLLGK
ncbi:hypothetical protein P175DRAFT_0509964 [Aspergillus ochraceoroseus IBT 24754]|uniref:C2H2-type domain-containing protein n=1 Tax=Aspergillus ochraceoroseus IBT 24754 TaxID=1392256 RepID=A0A2T5LUS8_9EURO|nr:uncharacterized protein P175DRAFT_0509964 [Aspergillus ochraceoroseus IBT 24754]PTU20003.1 hypothetical protein P175DRAFT_0509964 [Aspergillus ochraceoroseus IBT 24754]